MRRAKALEVLGLDEQTAASGLVMAYASRLSMLQQQLVDSQSEGAQEEAQAAISQLTDAFEFLGGTRKRNREDGLEAELTRVRPSPAAEAPPADIQPGDVLDDRYEVGPLLGRGGMGAVHEAFDQLKQEHIAIKVLVRELTFSAEARRRLLAEAKITCNLSHPNIVRVYDVGVSGSDHFITMQLLQGETLRQQMRRQLSEGKPFDAAQILTLTRPLIDALAYAHRFLVHRDIKPENIWISPDGSVKLMDFGIARVLSTTSMTRTGMSLGTAYYMAPEQLAGARDIDARADQYSIAVMLYELLIGRVPVGAVKPLMSVRRDLPHSFAATIMRGLSPQPEDRFASIQEFGAALEQRSWRDSKKRLVTIAASALLLAAGVGAAAFFMTRNTPAPLGSGTTVKSEVSAAAASPTESPASIADQTAATAAAESPEVDTTAANVANMVSASEHEAPAMTQPKSAPDVPKQTPPPAPAIERNSAPAAAVATHTEPRSTAPSPPSVSACEQECAAHRNACMNVAEDERRSCMRDSAFGGYGSSGYGSRDVSSGLRGRGNDCVDTWRSSTDGCESDLEQCKLSC